MLKRAALVCLLATGISAQKTPPKPSDPAQPTDANPKYTIQDLQTIVKLYQDVSTTSNPELKQLQGDVSALKQIVQDLKASDSHSPNKDQITDLDLRLSKATGAIGGLSTSIENLNKGLIGLTIAVRGSGVQNRETSKSEISAALVGAEVEEAKAKTAEALAEARHLDAETDKAKEEGKKVEAETAKAWSEQEKLVQERTFLKYGLTFWAIMIPVIVAFASFWGQFLLRRYSSDRQEMKMEEEKTKNKLKEDLRLKIADLLMASQSSQQLKFRADALKKLFSTDLDENFASSIGQVGKMPLTGDSGEADSKS